MSTRRRGWEAVLGDTLAKELRGTARPALPPTRPFGAAFARRLARIVAGFYPRFRTEGLAEQRPRV